MTEPHRRTERTQGRWRCLPSRSGLRVGPKRSAGAAPGVALLLLLALGTCASAVASADEAGLPAAASTPTAEPAPPSEAVASPEPVAPQDPVSASAPATVAVPAPAPAGEATWKAALVGQALGQKTSAFAIDSRGARSTEEPAVSGRLRLRLQGDLPIGSTGAHLYGALAGDAADGVLVGDVSTQLGDKLPDSRLRTWLPQEAWVGLRRDKTFGMQIGLTGSQWGLGLVADEGSKGLYTDRNPWFSAGRSGDRVARAMVFGMPQAGTDSILRGLLVSVALDQVIEDDVADQALGEQATQMVLATKLYVDKQRWVGLYGALRSQHHRDGKHLQVSVLDAAADLDWRDAAHAGLRVQGEAAWISGSTNLGPTPDFPEHDVSQLGALLAATWTGLVPGLTLQLDGGFFSGDGDFDDGKLNAFRADRNLRQGLLLFERVLAWQTGRSRLLASDPQLVGKPAEDLDRLASEGTIFNAITVFPKIGYDILDSAGLHLQVYGGALVAFAPSPVTDPYAARVDGGGYARNALGATPDGRLLGTELDAGLRLRYDLPEALATAVQLACEYGYLIQGGALRAPDGDAESVSAMRLTLSLLGR